MIIAHVRGFGYAVIQGKNSRSIAFQAKLGKGAFSCAVNVPRNRGVTVDVPSKSR